MIPLGHITKVTRNRGGLRRIDLIFENDIDAIPRQYWGMDTINGMVEMKTGTMPYCVYFSPKTGLFDEESQDSDAGEYYTQQLSFFSPHDRPLHWKLVNRLLNNRVAISYQDRNGRFKLLRNMRPKIKSSSGQRGGAKNGTYFTFSGKSLWKTPFWNVKTAQTENADTFQRKFAFTVDFWDGSYAGLNVRDTNGLSEDDVVTVNIGGDDYEFGIASISGGLVEMFPIEYLNFDLDYPTSGSSGFLCLEVPLVNNPLPIEMDCSCSNLSDYIIGGVIGDGGTGTDTGRDELTDNAYNYTHTQSEASTVWVVPHNLGYSTHRPTIMSDAGVDLIESGLIQDIQYFGGESLEIRFKMPTSGKAYITAFQGKG